MLVLGLGIGEVRVWSMRLSEVLEICDSFV